MARLVIRLLGPMQVTLDNRPITGFESDRVRALLSYLAVESQVSHTRQKLAGLLWPDHPEEKARTNLRRALYNLRKAIGDRQTTPPYLDVSHQTIGFERGSDAWIDVIAFTDMTQTSRPARLRTIQQWREGIELYRGGFLEGFSVAGCPAFEEWALLQGERLHCLALDALRRLADWYEGHAELAVALEYARRRLELDLLQESAHRQVMRLLAHSGLREAALAQYEICQLQLEKDLGVEPAPETVSLYEDIRKGIEVPIPALSLTHSLRAPLTPFIGREKELAELVQHLQSPGCRLITLIGPGGIGNRGWRCRSVGSLWTTLITVSVRYAWQGSSQWLPSCPP